MKVLQKINDVKNELNSMLLERETAVDAALSALVTGEHVLFLGPPGTAKSLLVRSICERISGTVYFERLLTKFSTPEELFGPLSLKELENDRYTRVKTGSIVEADIAFIDEVFKGNSSILNSLLALMNENVYHENGAALPAPLMSMFAASNETPEDASLDALYDRFLLRVQVPYIAGDDSFKRLLQENNVADVSKTSSISKADLNAARAAIKKIAFSNATVDAVLSIKHELEIEGVFASDRRWKACVNLIKAQAWFSGEGTANEEHTEITVNALWNTPEQKRIAERCVNKIANPLNLEAVELEDAAKDLYDRRPEQDEENFTNKLEPLLRQLSDIHTRLETRIANTASSRATRAKQAMQKVEQYHNELSSMALRCLSKLHTAPGAA